MELIIYFGHNSHIPIHWSHMSSDQNPPFDKETKMRSFSRRHHYDRFKIEGERISENRPLFLKALHTLPFPSFTQFVQLFHLKKCQHRFGQPPLPRSYLMFVNFRAPQDYLLKSIQACRRGTRHLAPSPCVYVHFLEQLWQEPIYYCKIRRNSPGLGSTGEFLRILQ